MPPESADEAAIVRALGAGNGPSDVVADEAELLQRLAEDGTELGSTQLPMALGKLIGERVVERRPGVGMWLSSGAPSVRVEDGEPDRRSAREQRMAWGPDGSEYQGPRVRYLPGFDCRSCVRTQTTRLEQTPG
jgi:hypothetical protein